MSRRSSRRSFNDSFSSLESLDTVCIEWPMDLDPIRQAIFHLLCHDDIAGIRCSSEQLVTPLNSLGGFDGSDQLLPVDTGLIHRAFKGSSDQPFYVPYCNLGIAEEGVLYACVGVRSGSSQATRKTYYDFGFYDEEGIDGPPPERALDERIGHPLNNWVRYRRTVDIPGEVKEALRCYLTKKKAAMEKRRKREKDKSKKEAAKRERERGQPAEISPHPASRTTPT